ncbi:CU044_2847 family protein [Streptomyces hygroscopicus]|uniref:CU044_2847 family protein n=1 Tax=Streptomyces hygroscopicus TaxID=1912 RepID=UPI00367F8BFB
MAEHDRTVGETVVVPVTQDGVRIQVFAGSAEAAVDGEETEIGARRPGLDQVISGLNAVARAVGEQARQSTASKVTLEFGCDIALESGSLVAAIGKASAKSAFKVTLEWDSTSA